ncbi:MAG: flavodoxin domain-containing protein [Candidatus Omnitrophica bacterium]|nr:flavodoxin domain-containing protein [Candidatus Omnitrophota bacterium]MDD5553560.1 flavodoxin domain-containing protein [Candidatus Omnitrophota bacterium]
MAKALIIYYSRTGNTRKMAEIIAKGMEGEGLKTDVKDVKDVDAKDLLEYDAIAVGSPTYYGAMASEIKKLWDDSVKFHGKLEGKIGAAFASSANVAGGNETTVLDILNAMLIHGMIIQGDPKGDHYGAVAIGSPDARASNECLKQGKRIAELLKRLK